VVFAVENLNKSYTQTWALKNVSFTVKEGELVTIIGPSGAGKSTMLKIIAGIESCDSGSLRLPGGAAVLVFQNYILFPYLNVFENIAFGLRARKIPKNEIRDRVENTLSFFDLSGKAGEFPARLSAGQKQRVALARAMVIRPALLLLDEPFANLDKNLKLSTAEFIRETQRSFGITTIAVTHDQAEAFAMSDRIGVLLNGALRQIGTFHEIYNRPNSLEVAQFLGPVNIIPGELEKHVHYFSSLLQEKNGDKGTGNKKQMAVRAENVLVEPDPAGNARVLRVYPTGTLTRCIVDLKGHSITAENMTNGIKPGQRVHIKVRQVIWV
jgi:putative spermidine/putrescine transport system ATP-binding protein